MISLFVYNFASNKVGREMLLGIMINYEDTTYNDYLVKNGLSQDQFGQD